MTRGMQTQPDDDEDRPDEMDEAVEQPDPGFGEHDDAAQEQEWAEDAREGGGG